METETSRVLISLLIVFGAGKLMGEVFERLRQPAVIGELLAGIIIGPGLLGWVEPGAVLSTVATMGVIVLMFVVGLETRPSELFKVGGRALVVGSVGIVLPLACGYWFGMTMGNGRPEALFIGTALVATSVGITARVLADRGFLSATESRIILAAAVIDDVLGMLVLSLVVGSSRGGVDIAHMAVLIGQVVVFVGFELLIAPKLVSRHAHWLDKLKIPNAGFVVALIVMLGMAALSEAIGLAGIVGAFFAGMMFAETEDRWELTRQTRPLYEWLVPYFFVVTGMQVQPSLFADSKVLVPGLVLVAIALATKVIGCGLGAAGMGYRKMLAIGIGMVPRGEVGLIVASTGLAMGVIGSTSYAMIIMVVVASTVAVPPLLAVVFPWAMTEPIDPVAELLAEAPVLALVNEE
ncbi:MAG: cation:proton antiporter [Coriobacteriia bacterium]|nr:cation:proton antiporter [Coriobacteriia bacterium]